MTIGTISYTTIAKKSFFNTVVGSYRTPRTITQVGTISVSTSDKKFGAGSMYLNAVGNARIATSTDFIWGANGAFTYEGWYKFKDIFATQFLFDQRTASGTAAPIVYYSSGNIYYYTAGAQKITGSWTPGTTNYYHIALSSDGTDTKLFVDGTQVGSTYSDTNTYVQGGDIAIGADYANTSRFSGWIDEFRVSNVRRYSANFTSSTIALMNDANTLCLIHADDTIRDYVN